MLQVNRTPKVARLHALLDVVQATKGIMHTGSPTDMTDINLFVLVQVEVQDSPNRVVVESDLCSTRVIIRGNHIIRHVVGVSHGERSVVRYQTLKQTQADQILVYFKCQTLLYHHIHFLLVLFQRQLESFDLLFLRRITRIFKARTWMFVKRSWLKQHTKLVECRSFWALVLPKWEMFSCLIFFGSKQKCVQGHVNASTIERDRYLDKLSRTGGI